MVVPVGLTILNPGLGSLFLTALVCVNAEEGHHKVETGYSGA